MKIDYGIQINSQQLEGKNIDLFIFAGNHEKRVSTAYNFVKAHNFIRKTIMFCYKDAPISTKDKLIEKVSIEDNSFIFSILNKYLENPNIPCPTVFVDYSCMTKSWYYAIILYFSNKRTVLSQMKVYFSYTPSKFSVPLQPKHNTEIAPLPGKYIVPTDKPKALIVCLGYEQNKAEGIINHLDPKVYYIFYTKPTLDNRFVKVLETSNEDLLSSTKQIITYKFDDLLFLERELTALYFSLREEYSIIIAPLGPKPFTFIAMLLSVRYQDIDIWRVGSGSDINKYERKPISKDHLIISEMVWSQEENNVL